MLRTLNNHALVRASLRSETSLLAYRCCCSGKML